MAFDLLRDGMLIDFEASSLMDGSWPIEVGLAWFNEDMEIESWGSLIRPEHDWIDAYWLAESQAIHGITREELNHAPHARNVAEELLMRTEGKVAFCDGGGFDRRWCNKLLEATPSAKDVSMAHYEQAQAIAFDDNDFAWEAGVRYIDRTKVPHRAREDAVILATGILKGLKVRLNVEENSA